MAEFSTRTIVPADGVKLPAVNENLANPSGNMTLSSLKSYVLGNLPTDVQTNTEDIGENTSDIEGIRGSSQAFDATAAYSAGDYCIYENVLYRFTSAKSAGAWDSTIVSVVDLPTLDGAITSLVGRTENKAFVNLTNGISSNVYIGMVNGLVIITSTGTITLGTGYTTIGTVPNDYKKPSQTIVCAVNLGSTSQKSGFMRVSTDGTVEIYNGTGASEGYAWGQIIY